MQYETFDRLLAAQANAKRFMEQQGAALCKTADEIDSVSGMRRDLQPKSGDRSGVNAMSED